MKVSDLKSTEYNSYYSSYINKVSEDTELITGFKQGENFIVNFFKTISKDKLNYRYAKGKWSIKEVFQHIIDTERIFMYRCFRIARHDKTNLMGYEQDDYIKPSGADKKSIENLLEEYKAVRLSFIILLKSLTDKDLKSVGQANATDISARASAFIILGHEIHHINIIRERYLS